MTLLLPITFDTLPLQNEVELILLVLWNVLVTVLVEMLVPPLYVLFL
jgi:hypothetical protein